jgi:two-component system sensor histidine kinase RegB
MDHLVREWRATRNVATFVYDNLITDDTAMVADTTLEQMVFNVLDNARDASPHYVQLHACRDADVLCITITDRGAGFDAHVLSQLGQPYQSTKGKPGGGLGLFLSMNVARTLGGSLHAENLPSGGARVTITLSMNDISMPETESVSPHGN